jgi:hypothetical protein
MKRLHRPPFDGKDFLSNLSELGVPRTMRCRNWTALYSRFIKSPNFRGWLIVKERTANAELLRQSVTF